MKFPNTLQPLKEVISDWRHVHHLDSTIHVLLYFLYHLSIH